MSSQEQYKGTEWHRTVSHTLEELWISYNIIEKLKPLEVMSFKNIYVSNNSIKDWAGFNRMAIHP
ncbi:hypothetical protein DOY81_010925 [Sarcophaga bullata]|nr:hypothetical protein DOY81_010925 [Sarcophaga bullata]